MHEVHHASLRLRHSSITPPRKAKNAVETSQNVARMLNNILCYPVELSFVHKNFEHTFFASIFPSHRSTASPEIHQNVYTGNRRSLPSPPEVLRKFGAKLIGRGRHVSASQCKMKGIATVCHNKQTIKLRLGWSYVI